MTALSELIEAASRANRGRSMKAAADLATRHGSPISKSHISKNAHRIVSITPQLVRGIAAGYGVSEEDVIRAALTDLGFTVLDYNPSPESAIRRDPNLSVEARAMLLAALDAARAELAQSVGAGGVYEVDPFNLGFRRDPNGVTGEAAGEDRREQRR